MSWKNHYQKLYKSTRKKVGNPSEVAFDKALQRKSNSLGLASSEAALIILAAENAVGYSRDLKKLNETQQGRVAQIIQSSNGSTSRVSDAGVSKNTKKRSIKSIPEIGGDFEDPYLSTTLYNNISYEGYAIMFVLENSIRNFILKTLKGIYGDDWWVEVAKKNALSKLVSQVIFRKTNESDNWHHAKRGVHEIYYTDYSDLLQIIGSFNSDFLKYFRKGKEKNLLEKLNELAPSRNVIAHNNPISSDDLDRLKIHAKDWFKYMQHLHKSGI